MNTIERGQQAQRLLNDPLVKEALDTVRQAILASWESSTDSDTREGLWHSLKATEHFKRYFEVAIETGELDLHNLKGSSNGDNRDSRDK